MHLSEKTFTTVSYYHGDEHLERVINEPVDVVAAFAALGAELATHHKIRAIRLIRAELDLDLKGAKAFVESARDDGINL